MSLKKLQEEYRSTPKSEVREALFENFVYGLLGSVLVVFISLQNDIAVLLGYLAYYFFLGRVVNRPKYVTSLGKFIVFPASSSMGAFIGYKLALYFSSTL